MEQLTFGLCDYLVFSTLLGISIIIGIYFGFFSKQDTVKEYIYAGKTMSYIPIAISGLSSFLSGITYLGFPTEVYMHGSQYVVEILGVIVAAAIMNSTILPVFFKLQLSCTTEYLELRFSKAVRKLCSVTYVIGLITYSAIVIYAPAIAFSHLTGVELHLLTLVICSICIFYTSLGGIKAVVWTDTFQFIFTFGSFFSLLVIGIMSVGGLTNIWDTSMQGGRIIFDLNPSIYERCTFWTVMSSTIFMYLGAFGVSQKHVQKLLTIHEEKQARKAVWAIFLGCGIIKLMCLLVGLTMYTKYHGCDPLTAGKIKRLDELLPYFVMDIAGTITGLPGVFLAGLISSGLATLSAVLNTLGSMIYDDFLKVWLPEKYHEDKKAATIMKIITVVVGLIAIGLVFVAEHMGTIFEIAASLGGILTGTLLGLFVVGMIFPWIGTKGALVGGYSSLILMSVIIWGTKWYTYSGRIRYENLPVTTEKCSANDTLNMKTIILPPLKPEDEPWAIFHLSILHYTLTGTLTIIIIGFVVSYVTNEIDLTKVNPEYISPIMRGFLPKKEYLKVPLQIIHKDQKVPNDEDVKTVINEPLEVQQQIEIVEEIKKSQDLT